MLSAASVMMNGRGYAGVCMRKQWLMRRPVRSGLATTAAISSSVCRLPFISASTLPLSASSTARAAAAWLCGTSSIARSSIFNSDFSATAKIRARGPMSTGSMRPAARASSAADKLTAVAWMNDGHPEFPERPDVLQQPHEIVALRKRYAHLRQRAARALDAFRRRDDGRLAGDHRPALLVGAGAIEHQAVIRFVACGDRHRDGQRVSDTNRRVERQRLAGVHRTRTGQTRAKHGGDEGGAPHAVRDDAVETRRVRILRVDVRRIDVARHRGEQLDV